MAPLLRSFWSRLPVAVRAVLQGLVIAAVGVVPWPILVQANLRTAPGFPWAALVGLAWVAALVAWLGGWGAPRATAERRRRLLRLVRPPEGTWPLALGSGALFALGLVGLRVAGWMLVTADASAVAEIRTAVEYPTTTFLPLLLVGAVVAGVVEEAAFRGYMQVPLEERHSPRTAILVVAVLFAFFHFPSPLVLPVFALAATGWGILAYLTRSVVPGMILHTALDAGVWLWAVSNVERVERLLALSVLEGEGTATFGVVAAATVLAWLGAGLGFRALARRRDATRPTPSSASPPPRR